MRMKEKGKRMVRFGRECTERWQDENVDKEEKVGNERMIIGQERERMVRFGMEWTKGYACQDQGEKVY